MLIIVSDAYVVDNTVFRYTVYFWHFVFVCFYCTVVLHKLIMLLPTCPGYASAGNSLSTP